MKPTDDLDVFLATMGPRKTSAASEEVAFDSDIVHGIVESAKIVGLVHAIAVRMPRAGEQKKNRAVLVAGRNQLEAARHLGLERIDCKFVDSDDETFVQPVEIAENLFRKHLPVLQRSELIY